jgi:hypothetical protein
MWAYDFKEKARPPHGRIDPHHQLQPPWHPDIRGSRLKHPLHKYHSRVLSLARSPQSSLDAMHRATSDEGIVLSAIQV